MTEVALNVSSILTGFYDSFFNSLPSWTQNFINVFLLSLLVVIYAVFIWNFYRWVARKNVLNLNLRGKYSEHNLGKILNGFLYFLEYIILLPFMVFVWFAIFTLFLMLLTETLPLHAILVVSVVVLIAIRMTSYYKEDLARDLAKMIPLTLLAVAITQGTFSFEKVLSQLSELPSFLDQIWWYLVFIIIIEIVLRVVDMIFLALNFYDEEDVEADDTKSKK